MAKKQSIFNFFSSFSKSVQTIRTNFHYSASKLNRHRHCSVRVCPQIPQTYLKACKIGNLALMLRDPRHESRRFSTSEGHGFIRKTVSYCGNWDQNYADKCRQDGAKFVAGIPQSVL